VRRWSCQVCGYKRPFNTVVANTVGTNDDGFKLLGNGKIACPKCDAVHLVPLHGEIILLEGAVK